MTEIDKLNIGGKRERIVVGPKNEVKESWGKKKKKKKGGRRIRWRWRKETGMRDREGGGEKREGGFLKRCKKNICS